MNRAIHFNAMIQSILRSIGTYCFVDQDAHSSQGYDQDNLYEDAGDGSQGVNQTSVQTKVRKDWVYTVSRLCQRAWT
ncbi:MAG: hypothetical protein OXE92_00115 [Bacteroidetes bacterium]|nr:hypothetical protein [Bacteroidota bacterium]MCY4204113.1 hypothetical protein [Bacteroidota bacterium]